MAVMQIGAVNNGRGSIQIACVTQTKIPGRLSDIRMQRS